MTERSDLIETLERHRGFLLRTADGLTEEQARTTSTVSTLTIASLLHHVAGDALGVELLADARGAHDAGAAVEHRVDHARFTDEILGLQIVQKGREIVSLLYMLGQFALQLRPRMFALREQPQGAAFERERGAQHAG